VQVIVEAAIILWPPTAELRLVRARVQWPKFGLLW